MFINETINNEEEFLALKAKFPHVDKPLVTPTIYPCVLVGATFINSLSILDIYNLNQEVYPPELIHPHIIYPKAFMKKMCGKYYIYLSNHIPKTSRKQMSKKVEEKDRIKRWELVGLYNRFKLKFQEDFNLPREPFGPNIRTKNGDQVDGNWTIAHGKMYLLSNHSLVYGDIILIPKEEKKVFDWVEKNKPAFITKYENRKEIIRNVFKE